MRFGEEVGSDACQQLWSNNHVPCPTLIVKLIHSAYNCQHSAWSILLMYSAWWQIVLQMWDSTNAITSSISLDRSYSKVYQQDMVADSRNGWWKGLHTRLRCPLSDLPVCMLPDPLFKVYLSSENFASRYSFVDGNLLTLVWIAGRTSICGNEFQSGDHGDSHLCVCLKEACIRGRPWPIEQLPWEVLSASSPLVYMLEHHVA